MNLQRIIRDNITGKRIFCSFLILMLSFSYAYATNYSTSIFANSIKVADSNSYKNSEYHFSIQPPPNWKLLKNIPTDVSGSAIAMFSDNSKGQLATFVVFHRTISNQVLEAINSHTDKEVLDELTSEMTSKSQESQTNISKAGIERYSDGVRMLTFSSTTYSSDNSTSYSADMIYYLNTGDQYTLVLTSNSERFDQDLVLFGNSIDTFYVGPNNTSIQTNIPAWIKNNAKWWADGTITDTDFIKGIQYMIDTGIVIVPHSQVGPPESKDIPTWIKNNAKWWADGTITDEEFAKGIEYLINNGILKS
ncbi:MAG: hypothetical protein ABI340_08670 [Nitrososphaera sp.]|jgi:hypothetical protein